MESCFNSRLRLQLDTQCTYNLKIRCFQVTNVVVENQSLLNILIECLHPLISSKANRMLRVILVFSFVACLNLQYHLYYLKYGNVSKTVDRTTLFLISVQSVLETFLILSKTDDML